MIHLVNMPFGSLTSPNLALSLMRSQLGAAGLDSRVFNLNFDFANKIGFNEYETIALFRGVETQIGEWLFAEQAWGKSFGPSVDEFLEPLDRELGRIPNITDKKQWLQKIRRDLIPSYLWQCLLRLEAAGDMEAVGFSCSLFQTISSLALGRLIKQEHPETKLVYGGACFHGEMGEELIQRVPWIDAVSTGEADDVIVPLFQSLTDGRPPGGLQGILYRDDGEIQKGPASRPVECAVFENLPDPDYSDFFLDAGGVGLLNDPGWLPRLNLLFESSRGCWWGEKQHCTFCGLNGRDLTYRAKSPERVFQTLANFSATYPGSFYRATDNNLSMNSFDSLIPKLKNEPPKSDLKIFYEVKSNMNRSQIKALSDAGIVYLQPGIESLSTHLLKLMRKGVSALQNIFFIKCCREYGIYASWNNLIRIPGEYPQDYDDMARLIPQIVHLNPPQGGARKIECHRFSPYFSGQAKGAKNVNPLPWYSAIYPSDDVRLSHVAYFFRADWEDTLNDSIYEPVINEIQDWLKIWISQPELPQLATHYLDDGTLLVSDTRGGCLKERVCDAEEAMVYRAISDPAGFSKIRASLEKETGREWPENKVQNCLQSFLDSDLAIEENNVFLGLALPKGTIDPPYSIRCLIPMPN